MRLIVTHNNADFDAIASLLALHKLEPTATPALPSRLQRNVESFLTLYAGLLKAVYVEDIDPASIEMLSIVDTQKHNFIRPDLPVHIIDHHPLTITLSPQHTFTGETLGANTTLLVEMLQREDIPLTPLEATLLSLGIYEDTGSLLYNATTPRDIRAAAWLLEHGANLDIVRDFLRLPLTDEQLAIYNQLRDSVQLIDLQGHNVLMTWASTERQIASLSSVVYQISTLYDPDGIFALIQIGPDVQMIARSSVDAIDVGDIARRLGGGGHQRAAAALVRQNSHEALAQQILGILQETVKPSITVAELMSSSNIETVSPSTRATQAAQLMQISGHEGYPVVQDSRVLGLLTRRAVDKSISHKLGQQSVEQIMEAGPDIFVRPHDSIETLRQKMIDTGWGQMPVVDESQKLIGIVTRTDLIRRWGEKPRRREHLILLERLQNALPAALWDLIQKVVSEAEAQKADLYLVGGLVRDLLLGVPNLDIDFVVEGDAIKLVETLCSKYGGKIRSHAPFGTAKWYIDQLSIQQNCLQWSNTFDFASARAEFYKEPTVLPSVRLSSIKQDLHRRDFTINSMAIRLVPNPMGDLIDFYHGQRDLEQKIIRVLHSLSFIDDPTRMIRAVRFEQRLGFSIEPRTEKLINEALPFLERVTGERLYHELTHILHEAEPIKALSRLAELGILPYLVPDLSLDSWFQTAYQRLLDAKNSPPWPLESYEWDKGILILASLRSDPAALSTMSERLLMPRTLSKILEAAHHAYLAFQTFTAQTRPSEVVELLEKVPPDAYLALWAALPDEKHRHLLTQYVQTWQHIVPHLDGQQLQEMGIPPGPQMGILLRNLRQAWLDGQITDQAAERVYVEQWQHGNTSSPHHRM